MKKILIAAALTGMLFPELASAEFNYNAVDAGYSVTSYRSGNPDQREFDVGISKSISRSMFLGASYGAGRQPTYTALGDREIKSISLGAGYHTPLKDKVDAIVKGHIVLGSAKFAGKRISANGYNIGVGVRAQFRKGLEGSLALVHASTSNGTFKSINTFLNVQFGFNFTPKFQATAGIDFKPDLSTNLGMRFYY